MEMPKLPEANVQVASACVEHCVLPDIAQAPVLAPLPQYRRFPWDPLPRNPI